MTEAEKNEIVGLVMTEISSQAVDFDITTEQPQANDLLTAVRQTSSGEYKGVTLKWDDVARIATELANQAATRAEQAKTNVENMKASVEQTVTDFNALAEEKKQEVQGVYQNDLNELKGDLDDILIHDDNTNFIDKRKMELGYINAEGGVNYSTGFYHTDYIELEENVPYNWAFLLKTYYAFYDNAKNVLSTYSTLGDLPNNFTIPSGAKYGRFSLDADRISWGYFISTHGGTIPDYAEIIDDNKIKGLTTVNEKINAVEKSIAEIKLSAFEEIKDRLSFGIGQIDDNGQFISNWPYRISSNKNEQFDYTISVKMDDGFSCGFVTFDSQGTKSAWSGWATEHTIPANTIFKIQTKCDTDIDKITDVRDNVIYKAMHIKALSDSDLMVKELTEDATFDFSNPLKIVRVATWKWTQGACAVGNKYVGFNASNDDHTNTGYANIGMFDDFSTSDRITHNLGHCASADYDEFTDTMLVANGTDASGVSPSVFLIKNAKSIVENKTNIVYGSDGVIEIPFDGIDGEGIVACFGENSNIIYVVSTESASLYYQKGEKYIYRVVLGMGNYNMNTLFDSNNFGTYIENCSDNEFNGTAHILEKYTTNWLGELQGLKYINGKLVFSTDLRLNNVGTGFLTVVKLSNGKAKIEKNKWIPCIIEKTERVDVETEGVLFNGSDGYVTAISKFSTGNVAAVYRFNLCEL